MPRGISSRRKSPITSPWSAVFTSSPGITISRRPRARSTASSAPPKTLWSVTAIAPSPCASAWSSSSSTSIEQSCDQLVCRWRSATIQSRSANGGRVRVAAPAGGEPLVDLLDPVGERLGRLRLRRREALRGAAGAEGLVLDHPRRLGGGELGLLGAARRSGDRDACRLGLGDEARQALGGGDEDRGRPEQLGARGAGARGAHAHPSRAAAARRPAARRGCASAGARAPSRAAGRARGRARAGAAARSAATPSRRASASSAGANSSGSIPCGTSS